MNIESILSATVISTVISVAAMGIDNQRKIEIKHITAEREKWRNDIKIFIIQLQQAETPANATLPLTELKMRINAYGLSNQTIERKKRRKKNSEKYKNTLEQQEKLINYKSDRHIWELITEIESLDDTEQEKFKELTNKLIKYFTSLLKYDWERSKNEIKGDSLTKICVGTAIFFIGILVLIMFLLGDSNLISLVISGSVMIIMLVAICVHSIFIIKNNKTDYNKINKEFCNISYTMPIIAFCAVIYLGFLGWLSLDIGTIGILFTFLYPIIIFIISKPFLNARKKLDEKYLKTLIEIDQTS